MTESFARDPLDPQLYYAGVSGENGSLKDRFKDIDDANHFRTSMQQLVNPKTRNFVLDFGNEDAYCATDLATADFKALLTLPVREHLKPPSSL